MVDRQSCLASIILKFKSRNDMEDLHCVKNRDNPYPILLLSIDLFLHESGK